MIEHDCSLQRGIGYYLEFVLYVAPFMKTALELRLRGVTNDRDDPSVSSLGLGSSFSCSFRLGWSDQIFCHAYHDEVSWIRWWSRIQGEKGLSRASEIWQVSFVDSQTWGKAEWWGWIVVPLSDEDETSPVSVDRRRQNQTNQRRRVGRGDFDQPTVVSQWIISRFAMRVSPSLASRLIETAKGLLLKFLPDVYIYVDHQKGANAGL